MTDRQKLALSLDEAGYNHEQIAKELGLKWRESATRLIARARAAKLRLRRACVELLEGPSLP